MELPMMGKMGIKIAGHVTPPRGTLTRQLLLSRCFFFLLLVVLPQCTKSPIAAKVGNFDITTEEVALRDRVIRFYYPQETRSLGLKQLVEAYVNAQILANQGRPVTEAQIEQEVNRIDKSTKMPEALKEIKQIFGGNAKAYRRVFVIPVLVNRVLRFEFFPNEAKLHEEALNKAKRFLASQSRSDFKKTAESSGGHYVRFEVTPQQILLESNAPVAKGVPVETQEQLMKQLEAQRSLASSAEATLWAQKILSTTKVGQVFPEVIDFREKWLVARRLAMKRPGHYLVEGVQFPKADYYRWWESEKEKVSIQQFAPKD